MTEKNDPKHTVLGPALNFDDMESDVEMEAQTAQASTNDDGDDSETGVREHPVDELSELPSKVTELSDTDHEILATQLASFKGVSEAGQKEAQRLLAIVAVDKEPAEELPAPVREPVRSVVKTQIRVGRDPSCNDFVINDKTVSSKHALLALLPVPDGNIRVQDLGSSNGTHVSNSLGGWDRVSETVLQIGKQMKFGEVVIGTSKDAQGITHLHFIDKLGKLSPSMMFFMSGEQQGELHRLEQARLDAEAAAKQPKPLKTPEQLEAEKKVKSTSEIKKEVSKSAMPRYLGVAILLIGLLGFIVVCMLWVNDHMHGNGVVADGTVPDASTTTDEMVTDTLSETTESTTDEVATDTVEATTEIPSGYACRAGSSVTSCNEVRDFLLSRADGASYWDCSGITPRQYRDMYRVDDPTGARHIIANTCACNYCEVTAHD